LAATPRYRHQYEVALLDARSWARLDGRGFRARARARVRARVRVRATARARGLGG